MKNVSAGTVTRTVLFVLALINQGLALFHKSPLPIDSEQLSDVISFIFTTITGLLAWWKNNSFTKKAIQADEYLKQLKSKA